MEHKTCNPLDSATHNDLVKGSAIAGSFGEIKTLLKSLCDNLEMDCFIYGSQFPISFVKPITIIVDGYPETWRRRYREANYLKLDPTVSHCRQSTVPIVWFDLQNANTQVASFFDEASDHGLCSGISVPVHGAGGEWAMLSLASSQNSDRAKPAINDAQLSLVLLAPFVHEAVRRLVAQQSAQPTATSLTPREKEVLLWTAEGKTAWDISQILNISERTVVFHLQNTAEKLNVCNRTHAVARALSLGLINPLL